jgi:hypothetical protein
MLPDALMMTSWPGCGMVLVLQLLAVFHDDPLPPTQLTVLNNSRLSNTSRQHPMLRPSARRGFFLPPEFGRWDPAGLPNTNGICLYGSITDVASDDGYDCSYIFYRMIPLLALKFRTKSNRSADGS